MKLVFFGTGEFALPSLERLADRVALVVTQPDRASGRGGHLQATPVNRLATKLGLPVVTPERARGSEFVHQVAAVAPDALIVASYGQILSQAMLDTAMRGGINLHGSLLPKYRGAAPIQRAILNGDLETGVTLMQMDRGMDTGGIIEMRSISIEPDATYGEVQSQLAVVAADMIEDSITAIVAGQYHAMAQDSGRATIAPKIEKAEAELSMMRPAVQEYNRFRAFTPSPGAFLRTPKGALRIWQARLGGGSGNPGEVLAVNDACEIAFADGCIRLLEVQPEGKKRMSGRDFANGLRLKAGSSLAVAP